jgi:acetyltransferase
MSLGTYQLKDGTIVTIRAIRPDDAPRLQALFHRLSRESAYFRFLGFKKELSDEEAIRLAGVDGRRQAALAAAWREKDEEKILGVARYALPEAPEMGPADFAIAVEDKYQGQGLGITLLRALVAYARALGINAFLATVSAENARMLRFLERSGFPMKVADRAPGLVQFRIDLEEKAQATKRSRSP